MKIYPVTLGCPKNRTDTEKLLAVLAEKGWEIVLDPTQADILFINTCAFIQEAVEESLEVIFELAEEKLPHQRLVVAGCLVSRYREELLKELPEVDLFLGIEPYREPEKLLATERSLWVNLKGEEVTRRILTVSPFYAYLKVTEGCSRACSFCTIPRIRGPLRSIPEDFLIAEARELVAQGVEEIILVGQDVSAYGLEQGSRRLVPFLKRFLEEVPVSWLRLLYLHPEGVTPELIALVAEEKRLLPYFDLPIQHVSLRILKAMRRSYEPSKLLGLVEKIRAQIPHAALRTSVMVGFPGETEKEFEELLFFLKEAAFDHLGAFIYSPEEGTLAAKLPGQLSAREKEARFHEVMRLQQEISAARLKERKGQKVEVLVEGLDEEGRLVGHAAFQAPEIDGLTVIKDDEAIIGGIVEVEIEETDVYDVYARPSSACHAAQRACP